MTNSSEQQSAEREAAAPEAAAPEATAAEGPPNEEHDASGGEASAEETPSPNENEEAPATEAEALRAELEALREEQEETNDRLLRTAAELRNVRRRAAEDGRRRSVQARVAALRPMLEVLDDLQRALAAANDDGSESGNAEGAFQSLRSGVEMVEDKFESALAGLGVEPIPAEGEPFDETLHEAMMQQPAPGGTDPGTVLAEVRRGYRMTAGEEERVLRHSRVVVATAPESSPEEENSEENEAAGE